MHFEVCSFIKPSDAANQVAKVIAVINDWQAHFQALGVTEADIVEVAALIDAPDLLAQRQSFRADAYAGGRKPRRKAGSGAKAFR